MYGSNLLSDAFLIVLFLVSFGFSGVPSYCLLPYLPLFIIGIGVAFAECLVEIIWSLESSRDNLYLGHGSSRPDPEICCLTSLHPKLPAPQTEKAFKMLVRLLASAFESQKSSQEKHCKHPDHFPSLYLPLCPDLVVLCHLVGALMTSRRWLYFVQITYFSSARGLVPDF